MICFEYELHIKDAPWCRSGIHEFQGCALFSCYLYQKIKYVFLSTFFTADYDVLFRVFLFVRIMDCEFLTRTR